MRLPFIGFVCAMFALHACKDGNRSPEAIAAPRDVVGPSPSVGSLASDGNAPAIRSVPQFRKGPSGGEELSVLMGAAGSAPTALSVYFVDLATGKTTSRVQILGGRVYELSRNVSTPTHLVLNDGSTRVRVVEARSGVEVTTGAQTDRVVDLCAVNEEVFVKLLNGMHVMLDPKTGASRPHPSIPGECTLYRLPSCTDKPGATRCAEDSGWEIGSDFLDTRLTVASGSRVWLGYSRPGARQPVALGGLKTPISAAWRTKLPVDPGIGMLPRSAADSLVFDDVVIVHYEVQLDQHGLGPFRTLAVDGADGKLLWRRDDLEECRFISAYAGALVLTRCPAANQVQIVSPRDGKVEKTIIVGGS